MLFVKKAQAKFNLTAINERTREISTEEHCNEWHFPTLKILAVYLIRNFQLLNLTLTYRIKVESSSIPTETNKITETKNN